MEHLTSIEGRDRDEVNGSPENTDDEEDPDEFPDLRVWEVARAIDQESDATEDKLDGGTSGGDEEGLLAREASIGEDGHSTDAVKDHVGSSSEFSAREGVAHFVNEDGEESRQDEEPNTEEVGGVFNSESATDHG